MKAWLLRPVIHKKNYLDEFKNTNKIAIGSGETGDLTGKSREEIKRLVSGALCYGSLDIFVNSMHSGDYVLIPEGDDIYFCEITGEYCYDLSTIDPECPHQRNVSWKSYTRRQSLSASLRTSLRAPRTAADLTKHLDEIRMLAAGKEYQSAMECKMLTISYPLRPDFEIKFDVPADISKDEAQRLSAFFATLYFDK